jgi:PAS domain S-box-containing protein
LVGGDLIRLKKVGNAAADICFQILQKKKVNNEYFEPHSVLTLQYDWREIIHWGIDPSLIPPNATTLFKEESIFEKYFWIIILIVLIIIIETTLISILLIYRRRQLLTEMGLIESESRFRILFEQTPEGIFIYDIDKNQIVDVNRNVEHLIGYSREEILHSEPQRFYAEEQPEGSKMGSFHEHVRRALNGEEVIFERIIRSREGKKVFCEVRLTRLSNQDTNLVRALFIDITERKKAEKALIEYRDHLEELVNERTKELAIAMDYAKTANIAKSVFLSNMSHELRTPLNAIIGYSQLFLKKNIGEDFTKGLVTIQKSGEHLLALINDILDIAKIEAGKIDLSPQTVAFPAFIDEINSIIQVRAKEKGLTFNIKIPQPLPAHVRLDEIRMRQVLLNILGNALKFTDHGRVIFRIDILKRERKDNGLSDTICIRFQIEDTGIGIPRQKHNLLFKPFEQIGDLSDRDHGTGLGLAISHHLVELMGSNLQFASEPGKGSIFWFDITIPREDYVSSLHEEPEQEIIGYLGERKRILVVDDIQYNRDLVIDLLQPLGFEIMQAENGKEAIQIAIDTQPDLIFMDLRMPVRDGYASIEEMRNFPVLHKTPIIAYSASVSESEQDHARMVGFHDFITKPISWSKLYQVIQKNLHIIWEYQVPIQNEVKIDEESIQKEREMVSPPEDILEKILELTERGDVLSVIEAVGSIEDLGEEYYPFAQKLRKLAEVYEMKEICLFIGTYVRSKDTSDVMNKIN